MQVEFEHNLNQILERAKIADEVFAVGVSGGADSMALVLLLKTWADKNGKKIVALTVDHGLRAESKTEAEYVMQVMKKYKIEHHILTWQGQKPKTAVEEQARAARYGLIEKWCNKNAVKTLLIAHHKQDQAETFLIRLQRGSGVDGLASMAEVSELLSLQVVRPLLLFYPEQLKDFLKKKKVAWVEDESNFSDEFLRGRVRKILPMLNERIGLCVDRLCDTAQRMARVRSFLDDCTQKFIKNNVKVWQDKIVSFAVVEFAKLHEEIALRVLSKLLMNIGQKSYPSRLESVENLYAALQEKNFKAQTLSDCEVLLFKGKIWIVPELKNVTMSKKDWESFLAQNPSYKKTIFPHKARLNLLNNK